ncbi:MAG: DoxX family protein [Opitutales bacterium]|nr:DoxX family protein [Opitutales bacterium]
MEYLTIAIQIFVALGILNVWTLRFGKQTQYRGGNAKNMKEEFSNYSLPPAVMTIVGILKIGCAIALLIGIFIPQTILPATSLLGILMVGAIAMHLKIKDSLQKSLPAACMLILCGYLVYASFAT